jgi:hypothetical protein
VGDVARKVYLHVGTPKSGTTFLQQLLWTNKSALASQGLLMAGESREDSLHSMMVIQERPRLAVMGERARTAWSRLVEEMSAWPGDALVSHEFLGMSSPAQAARAIEDLQPAEVHVVVTARDYLDVVPAVWQESVKIGSAPPFDEFLTRMLDGWTEGPWSWSTCDVSAVLSRWASTLPPTHAHVVTTPPPGAPPMLLWERFAAACDLGKPDVVPPEGGRNESLGRAETELMLRLNTRWPSEVDESLPERHRWVRGFLGQDVLVPRTSPKVTLSPHAAAAFRQRAREACSDIVQQGYAVHGDLADLVAVDLDSLDDPAPPTDAEVLDVAMDTIVRLVGRYRERALAAEARQAAGTKRRRSDAVDHTGMPSVAGGGRLRKAAAQARSRLAGGRS